MYPSTRVMGIVAFGAHFGSHLGFSQLEWPVVILMSTVGYIVPEMIHFATNIRNLCVLELVIRVPEPRY